jgi:hypothetical protein
MMPLNLLTPNSQAFDKLLTGLLTEKRQLTHKRHLPIASLTTREYKRKSDQFAWATPLN